MKQPQLSVDLAPHEQQLGKYRLIAKLGQGGMGTVYLALASGLGSFRKLLVVKELRHDLPWRESSISMFLDEAQLAARLEHPNVLQTFEAGESGNRFFLAMEYLDGQPLSSLIDHGIPLELHVHILCEVLQGLQYAHDLTDYDGSRLHVVHRDVSPQNVFITYHGQVKVVDFGVAKANNGSNITSPGVFKGKFAYAAPEQLFGRPVDGRCDVFAVGVMLWEAIAGRRFGVPKPTVDAFRVRTQGLEPKISQVTPEVDPLLAEICDHALMVDPMERVESADALRTRLQEWLLLQGEHIQSKQLAAFMRERFIEERVLRQRIIERVMIDAGASQSTIATLPRELFDRDSGMSPRVDGASEQDSQQASASASGISPSHQAPGPPPSEARPVPRREGDSVHTGHAVPTLSQADESVHAANPRLAAARMKQTSRLSSAAVLLIVAGSVFALTYQLSRKATEPASAPQLRSHAAESGAAPVATETTSAAATGAAHEPANGNPRDARDSQARDSAARSPALGSARERESTRDLAGRSSALAGSREPRESTAHDPFSAREPRDPATRNGARDPATNSTRGARESAARDSLDGITPDARELGGRESAGGGAREPSARESNARATREPAVRESAARDSLSGVARDAREAAAREPASVSARESSLRENPRAGRESAGRATSAQTAAPRDTAAARDSAAADFAAASQRAAALPPATGGTSKPAAAAATEDSAKAVRTRGQERAPVPKPRPAARDTGMGSDLRQYRNGAASRIDTEDPYK